MIGQFFEAQFPFIREDVFLVAQVNKITGRQKLVMLKVDLASGKILLKNSIECIHTAVGDIPVKDFHDMVNNPDFPKQVLWIRSSEQLKEVVLTPEERFKALKSWVAGIAEAGMNAFVIQNEIDEVANLHYPIALPLFRFMVMAESTFIFAYIEYLDSSCYFNGTRHEAYLLANLLPVLDMILQKPGNLKLGDVMEAVLAIDPPLDLFIKNEPIFRTFACKQAGFLTYFLDRVQIELRGRTPAILTSALVPVFNLIAEGNYHKRELVDVLTILLSNDASIPFLVANQAVFKRIAACESSFLRMYMEHVSGQNPRDTHGTWPRLAMLPVLQLIAHEVRPDILDLIMKRHLAPEVVSADPGLFEDLKRQYPVFLSYYLACIKSEWEGSHAGDKKWLRQVLKRPREQLDPRKEREVAEFLFQLDLPPDLLTVGVERRTIAPERDPRPATRVTIAPINGSFKAGPLQNVARFFKDVPISRGDIIFLRILGYRIDLLIKDFTPKHAMITITKSTTFTVEALNNEEVTGIVKQCPLPAALVLMGIATELGKTQKLDLSIEDAYHGFRAACQQYNWRTDDFVTFKAQIRFLTQAHLLQRLHNEMILLQISPDHLQYLLEQTMEDERTRAYRDKARDLEANLQLLKKYEKMKQDLRITNTILPDSRGEYPRLYQRAKTSQQLRQTLKILLMGEGGRGSTTVLTKYISGTFVADTAMTIGVQFFSKNIELNGVPYTLLFTDFAGQDRWRFLFPEYMAGAKGAILFFDTTRMSSLDRLDEWVGIARMQDRDLPILLCGTKLDLANERSVAREYARGFLEPLQLFDYIEVSAKTGENVEWAFEMLVRKILERSRNTV